MKAVSAKTMSELENKAYAMGFTENDFMENAGKGIASFTLQYLKINHLPFKVWLLCGKGNNGGDAFVAGRYLQEEGIEVIAIQPEKDEECTLLNRKKREEFERKGKVLKRIESFDQGIILDGIFGTGFHGKVLEPYQSLIVQANQSELPILAIDIPSGLNGSTGVVEGTVIQATVTLFLALPKIGFFLREGWNEVGELHSIDFGLPRTLIENITSPFTLNTKEKAASIIPPIKRNRHKYEAGYVIGIAGSPSMPGAALLSSLSAFRGGSGIVKLLHPAGMENELSSSPYELIKIPYHYNQISELQELINKAKGIFVGPGMGKQDETQLFLKKLIPMIHVPLVLDADALNLFAEENYPLPSQTIFTPHLGEMQTLLHSKQKLILNEETLKICQEYSEKNQITLILKGAPTFIFHPQTIPTVNPTGNPGMATAGSGDVLTGLLSALLSQGLNPLHAAILGTYLHGLAGELAAKKRGTLRGMMAEDLIDQFPHAYERITIRGKGRVK